MQKTDFPIEVLIHDDASTDGTALIIKVYEKKYPDIIKPIYQTENQWSKEIDIFRTFLLPQTEGKYLAFCEGDDYWIDDNYINEGVKFLEQYNEYNCYATSTIYKSIDSEKTILDIQNKEYDQIGHDISFNNYVYLHSSARISRNIFNSSPVNLLKKPYHWEIYYWYVFLDIGKVYFDHKISTVYRITNTGEWNKLTIKEQEKEKRKTCILANRLLSDKWYIFFWNIMPKNETHNILKIIIGIEKTMKLLFFFYKD
jgi:glycosyltransferase involved in cell wall biosynthesis